MQKKKEVQTEKGVTVLLTEGEKQIPVEFIYTLDVDKKFLFPEIILDYKLNKIGKKN